MDITVIQESFSAGEISPLTYGRFSTDGYASGCKLMKNMLPTSHGPAISRDGTKFHDEFTADEARLFKHQVHSGLFYSLIATDLLLTVYSIEGFVPAVNYTLNSRFHTLDADWTVVTSGAPSAATFEPHDLYMTVQNSPNKYVRVSQQVTVPSSGNYNVIVQTKGGSLYRVRVGTAENDGTYADVLSSATEEITAVTVPGTTFYVTVIKDSNDSYTPIEVSYIAVTDAALTATTFVTPWPETDLKDIHIIPVPEGDAAYFVHPRYPIQKIEYDIANDTYTFSTPTITSPPAVWTGSNYPSVGCYFQGRLWVGGTPEQPQSLWGSQSGLPEDFSPGTGLDAEAISITMAEFGGIEWMAGTKNLLVGTTTGENIIKAEGGILTPSDHAIQQQSAYGSASVQSVKLGDLMAYVSPDKVKLRAMQYEWSKDNWLSTDLTYFSEHITAGKVRRIEWLQNPANLFICLLEDGTFAVLSYDRSNNIYGWSQHDINDEVIDIAVASKDGTSILGVLVKRVDGKIYYESQALERNRYMDSWVENYYVTPTDTITGLDHLEGRTVQVLADDAMHPNRVVSSGSITLDKEVSKVLVGVGYDSEMTLLPLEKGAPTGTSAPYKKNFHDIGIHLYNSANPLINGQRPASRSPSTPMDTPEPPTSGRSYIDLADWVDETEINIKQDLPFPLIVLAISGSMAQEKL